MFAGEGGASCTLSSPSSFSSYSSSREKVEVQEGVREGVVQERQVLGQHQADYFTLLKRVEEEVTRNQVITQKLAEVGEV